MHRDAPWRASTVREDPGVPLGRRVDRWPRARSDVRNVGPTAVALFVFPDDQVEVVAGAGA